MTNIVDEWATYLRATGHTDATITQRTQWVRRISREIPIPLLDITAADVQGWLAHPSWKKTTRRTAQASLRQFYRWSISNITVSFLFVKPMDFSFELAH